MKPNFLIIGERRSGSTTLAKWIEAHPELGLLSSMDTAYFMDDELRGRKEWLEGYVNRSDWDRNHSKRDYELQFDSLDNNKKAIGEKSADYLFLDQCYHRIKKFYPDIKLVLILRNPVQRAWSHYINEIGKEREELSFDKALKAEDNRIERSEYAKAHLSYKNRGFYYQSLNLLYKTFDKSQVHVVILEHLLEKPKNVLGSLYDFLGIDSSLGFDKVGVRFNNSWTTFPKTFWKKNMFLTKSEKAFNLIIKLGTTLLIRDLYKRRRISVQLESLTRYSKDDIKMEDKTKKYLNSIYKEDIKSLEELLHVDLSCWKG